jgi:DNA-directed RNA polymerase specialized sigma54-like protein
MLLRFIRTLEPKVSGLCALSDCLCLQLPQDSLAYQILQEDEDSLARRHIPYLSRKYNVTFTAIEDIYRELRKLSHNPAGVFASHNIITKDPEIFLDKELKVTIPGERIHKRQSQHLLSESSSQT